MYLEGIKLSDISQRKRLNDFIYMWNIKKKMSKQKKKKKQKLDTENKRVIARGEVVGEISETGETK